MATQAERQEFVDEAESIMNLEGLSKDLAPAWFNELTQEYINGSISHEQAKQRFMEKVAAGGLNG